VPTVSHDGKYTSPGTVNPGKKTRGEGFPREWMVVLPDARRTGRMFVTGYPRSSQWPGSQTRAGTSS